MNYVKDKDEIEVLLTDIEVFDKSFSEECSQGIRKVDVSTSKVLSEGATPNGQLEYLLKGGYYNAPGLFIKAAVISDVGLYDESYFYIEDIPFYIKLAFYGKLISYCPITTVKYRKSCNNLTSAGNKILPIYQEQLYYAVYRTSVKYNKVRFILNSLWNLMLVKLIFALGNKGWLALRVNDMKSHFQPIRFFNMIHKLSNIK